jgi:5-dehydro-2-deoxygluconokinase
VNGVLDLVAIGRAGVDLYSLDFGVPLEEAKRFAKYVGGSTANTVVGGARLGLKCALVSRVSDDELGSFVLGFLKSEGVDVSHIKKDGKRKTGIVFAEVLPGKDGRFIFYRENAADLHVTGGDVGTGLLEDTKALLFTGTGLSSEPSLSTVLGAGESANKLGEMVVLNLDWRPSLWSASEEERIARYRKAISVSNVLVGNDKEYMAATGRPDLEAALGAIEEGERKMLVVTRGESGSEVRHGGKTYRAQGFKVPLIKGLGGGDGFMAGFLFGQLRGWGPKESATFGNAVGAIVVTGHACSESMPRLPSAASFLRRNGYSFDAKSGPSKH